MITTTAKYCVKIKAKFILLYGGVNKKNKTRSRVALIKRET